MPTVSATVDATTVRELLTAAARAETFFTASQLLAVVREYLPHSPERAAMISVLQIANAGSLAGRFDLEGRHEIAEFWRGLAAETAANALEADRGWARRSFDTSSSASRQHYIDTGRYLRPGEAEAV